MPTQKPARIPRYCLHKPSGQARVIVAGKHRYLGKHGTPESRQKYARLLSDLADQNELIRYDRDGDGFLDITVNELLAEYLDYAETYYSLDGTPTKEYGCMCDAVRPLRHRFGGTPVREFGPRRLKIVRDDMVKANLARTLINSRINRIRRVFKWGVSMELIPPAVHQAITTLDGLKFGRCNAKETEPVRPVKDNEIQPVLKIASPQVSAMIQLQRLTGMRPGEVVIMRSVDILRADSTWIFVPETHKNSYRGHKREIPLGPRAQEIIAPFLDRDESAYLFSPLEAEKWRSEQRRINRRSPVTPSQRDRKPSAKPKRKKRNRFDVDSYRRAIKYAILKHNRKNPNAKILSWHPHQLRHQFATVLRKKYGAEAVQIGLGHKSTNLIDLYAEKNLEAARKIAMEVG